MVASGAIVIMATGRPTEVRARADEEEATWAHGVPRVWYTRHPPGRQWRGRLPPGAELNAALMTRVHSTYSSPFPHY